MGDVDLGRHETWGESELVGGKQHYLTGLEQMEDAVAPAFA